GIRDFHVTGVQTCALPISGGLRREPERLIMGGPMMGIRLHARDVPVIKTTGCILAPLPGELGERGPTRACIRCGACAEVCPVSQIGRATCRENSEAEVGDG